MKWVQFISPSASPVAGNLYVTTSQAIFTFSVPVRLRRIFCAGRIDKGGTRYVPDIELGVIQCDAAGGNPNPIFSDEGYVKPVFWNVNNNYHYFRSKDGEVDVDLCGGPLISSSIAIDCTMFLTAAAAGTENCTAMIALGFETKTNL